VSTPVGGGRFDIADIVRAHGAELKARHVLSRAQRRVLTDIAQCRTEALGGHVEQCTACGYERPVYRSCRNRHCPKCQALTQEKWIEEQRQRMLDMKHFHVVFTLPAQLRPLVAFAPRLLYDVLLRAAGRTLLEFGRRNLEATLGATLVLHTWTRELSYHPHVHAIVTAGGLLNDGSSFRALQGNYLFPVDNLATVLRAKLLDMLWRAHRNGAFACFDDFADPEGFQRMVNRLPKSWNAYAKASFNKGEHVLQYLGRYTHRVGIANSRLLNVEHNAVTFRTKGSGTQTLHPVEFLHRLVQHVLPAGFHKIRHVGLYASVPKRDQARQLLDQQPPPRSSETWQERLRRLTGRDILQCPRCHCVLRIRPLPNKNRLRALRWCRAPPPSSTAALAS